MARISIRWAGSTSRWVTTSWPKTTCAQAVNRDQTDPTVHMHLGDLYEKTGRIRLAAAQWQLSLDEFAKSVCLPTLNRAT